MRTWKQKTFQASGVQWIRSRIHQNPPSVQHGVRGSTRILLPYSTAYGDPPESSFRTARRTGIHQNPPSVQHGVRGSTRILLPYRTAYGHPPESSFRTARRTGIHQNPPCVQHGVRGSTRILLPYSTAYGDPQESTTRKYLITWILVYTSEAWWIPMYAAQWITGLRSSMVLAKYISTFFLLNFN